MIFRSECPVFGILKSMQGLLVHNGAFAGHRLIADPHGEKFQVDIAGYQCAPALL